MKIILTLCLVQKDNNILLGMKKRGFGQGRWNGFGGKVDENESIEEAAKRELAEEAGIIAKELKKKGILNFHFENDPEVLEVHIFSTIDFSGQPQESEEMSPRWFLNEEIPFSDMWPDDKYWLPLLLAGKNFKGEFYFKDNNNLTDYALEEINYEF